VSDLTPIGAHIKPWIARVQAIRDADAKKRRTDPAFAALCAERDRELARNQEASDGQRLSDEFQERVKDSGIPEIFVRLFRKGPPKPCRAISLVERPDLPRVLTLCGKSGSGKSTAAAWAMWLACKQGHYGCWVDVAGLVRLVVGGEGDERLRAICERRLLVLDDLGWDWKGSGYGLSVLGHILDKREKGVGSIICTTNLAGDLTDLQRGKLSGEALHTAEALTVRYRVGDHEGERERNWRRLGGGEAGTMVTVRGWRG